MNINSTLIDVRALENKVSAAIGRYETGEMDAAGTIEDLVSSFDEAIATLNTVYPERQMGDDFVPMAFELPVGNSLDEWRENVGKTDLYQRGDTVLIWVNEGDLYPSGPFVKSYDNLLSSSGGGE